MMNENTAAVWWTIGDGVSSRWRPLALGLLVGALIGATLTLWAIRAGHAGPSAQPTALVREWPDRPIPREWRWERKPVAFDHMFRKRS